MTQTSPVLPDGRRYQILDVIGRGGFGNVYRARLEGGDGFFKDVAIKIAREANAPPEALQRFRDEARILGLIRDRALVDVDPPMRLDGRWAVVMEYVDGASCSRLLVRYGALPPTVVLEIGAEIARVLHKIYKHPGTDGHPLRLVHRDIKPANIQITPTGELKLLDFGIARAEFRDRESKTVMTIGGTRGYIAPERTTGLESPAGDVYSLGVVLHKLVTGSLPSDDDLGWEAGDPEPMMVGTGRDMALAMSHKMRALRPNMRPSAEEVQRLLTEMRKACDGDTLQAWAERVVPEVSRLAEDGLVGTTLRTGDSNRQPVGGGGTSRWLGAVIVVAILLLAVGLVVARTTRLETPKSPVTVENPLPEPVVDPEPPSPTEPAPVKPVPLPALVKPTVPVPMRPVPVRPDPSGVVDPIEPTEPVDVAPEETDAPVEPVEPVELPTRVVRITSIPMGAAVKVDGRNVGNTPLLDLKLTDGPHQVEISADQALIQRKIEVGDALATRYVWRVATGSWETGF